MSSEDPQVWALAGTLPPGKYTMSVRLVSGTYAVAMQEGLRRSWEISYARTDGAGLELFGEFSSSRPVPAVLTLACRPVGAWHPPITLPQWRDTALFEVLEPYSGVWFRREAVRRLLVRLALPPVTLDPGGVLSIATDPAWRDIASCCLTLAEPGARAYVFRSGDDRPIGDPSNFFLLRGQTAWVRVENTTAERLSVSPRLTGRIYL